MRKDLMPQAREFERPNGVQWDLSPQALERWSPNLVWAAAAKEDEASTISIFDPIGIDFWTGEGVTAKRISAALRAIGADKDVVVNINSPGGDLFEGLAIYSLFREHKGKVTVKVLGLAASAASVIAMAGDEVQIARAGFLMIHCTWVLAIGNRNDLRDIADTLEPFDFAMADVYAARTELEQKVILKKMDAETWINGSAAVDEGWADVLLPSDEVRENKSARAQRPAAYEMDQFLAKAGLSRTSRRALMQEFKGSTPSAAVREPGAPPSATEEVVKPSADVPPVGKPSATDNGKPSAADADAFLNSLKLPEIQI